MKAFLIGLGAALLGGCVSGGVRIEIATDVKAGETVDVIRAEVERSRDFSITITNLGPANKQTGGDYTIEIRNGAERLGRLAPGESGTFSVASSSRVDLKVRAEGGGTRFEGRIVERSR
jgi:hypothetical protein